ncbi:SRPBCC domain-containing protein [Paenibacillus nanensis]|uniref:SRPBCC domain-containing protein n=1 Tax=Paenibacillus nanensis TaxID=393251 RepID=A0A3A1UQZ4_9BACL|nr:SRPBCC domain-containing protein [Paenibacillus nanensis]RIX50226.1 SRPBCC domain-containing protein [Paenibacillus nanensis]
MSLVLTLDFQYTTTIEKLWSALTDSKMLAKWVLENDFKPVVGHKFQFRAEPNEYWDGRIDGEVLVVEPPSRLSYTWGVGEEIHTVIWTLQELGDGKVNLHLEQTGFSHAHGLAGAKHGWMNWCGELEKLLAQ